MGSFKMVVSIVTAVFVTLGFKPVIAGPSDDGVDTASSPFSRDYLTLQGILGNNLAGTATEKAKVLDLLLQLLEEIDLTALCEVIVNDTKGRSSVLSQVPIKSTKVDTKLLNKLRAQMDNEFQENAAVPIPFNNVDLFKQEITSSDSNIQQANDEYQESASNPLEDSMASTVIPATYKYHRNELRNVHFGLHGNEKPNINSGSFDLAKYPKLASSDGISDKRYIAAENEYIRSDNLDIADKKEDLISDNLDIADKKEDLISDNLDIAVEKKDFHSKKSEKKLAHEGSLSISGLPAVDDSISRLSGLPEENVDSISRLSGPPEENVDSISRLSGPQEENVDSISRLSGPPEENVDSISRRSGPPEENVDSISRLSGPPEENVDSISRLSGPPEENIHSISRLSGPPEENVDSNSRLSRLPKENFDSISRLSGLPEEDSFSRLNTAHIQSKKELKQMYLRSIGREFPNDDGTGIAAINTNGVKYENPMSINLNIKRPRAQLFSQSLVLGEWLNDERMAKQNQEANLMGNGKSKKKNDIMVDFENYAEDGDELQRFDKHESQKRFDPIKQNKESFVFLENEGTGRHAFGDKKRSPQSSRTTSRDERNINSVDVNIPETQHEVDYLEELRSTFRANKQVTNQPTSNHVFTDLNEYGDVYPEDETKNIIAQEHKKVIRDNNLYKGVANEQKQQTTPLKYALVNDFARKDGYNKYVKKGVSRGKINKYYNNDSEIGSNSQSFQITGKSRGFLDPAKIKLYRNMPQTRSHLPTWTSLLQTDLTDLPVSQKVTSASVPDFSESNDFVQKGSNQFDTNDVFEATTQVQLLPESVSAHTSSNGLNYLHSSTASSQQNYVSNKPSLFQEHINVPEKNYQAPAERIPTSNFTATTRKPGHTDSSKFLSLDSKTHDQIISASETQTISDTREATTSQDATVHFSSGTTSPRMEAKIEVGNSNTSLSTVEYIPHLSSSGLKTSARSNTEAKMETENPISSSLLPVEDIPTLPTSDAKSTPHGNTENDKNALQIELAVINKRHDDVNNASPSKRNLLPSASRLSSNTTSLLSTQATRNTVDPQSTSTSNNDFTNDININYRTEFDNFNDGLPDKNMKNVSKNEHEMNNTITNGGHVIKDTSRKTEPSFSATSTNGNKFKMQTPDSDRELRVLSVTLNILPSSLTNPSLQRDNVTVVNSSQSSSLPFINSVVMTTVKSGHINQMATGPEENYLSKTTKVIESAATNFQQDSSHHYTPVYKPTLDTVAEDTYVRKQQSRSKEIMTKTSMNISNLYHDVSTSHTAADVSTSHTTARLSSKDPVSKSESFLQELDIPDKSATVSIINIPASAELASQNISSTTNSHQTQDEDSTTGKPIIKDVTTFNKTNFFKATLHQLADFDKTTLHQMADFDTATLQQASDFDKTTLHQMADFDKATLQQIADFDKTTSSQMADFDKTTSSQITYFDKTTSSQTADFDKTTLQQIVDFDKTTLQQIVDFDKTTLQQTTSSQTTNFDKTASSQTAKFDRASLQQIADFDKTTLRQTADFDNGTSHQTTDFDKATFPQAADFDKATSPQAADFDKATSPQAADFDNLIQPVFIDYGDNRVYIKPPTPPINSEQNPTDIFTTEPSSKFNQEHLTRLDAEAPASQTKNNVVKITENYIKVENADTSSFDINRITNERGNATEIVTITLSEPAIPGTRSEVANLLGQLSHQNITADRLKRISSQVAQTKANLSEINNNWLKQSALRAQQKHNIEKTFKQETVSFNAVDKKNVTDGTHPLANTSEARKQTATSKDESLDEMTYNMESPTATVLHKTNTQPEIYFVTESPNFVSKVSVAAGMNEKKTSKTNSSSDTLKVATPPGVAFSISPRETFMQSLKASTVGIASLKKNYIKDLQRTTLQGYPADIQSTNYIKSDQINNFARTDPINNGRQQSDTQNEGDNIYHQTQEHNNQHKPEARPYISQYSDSVYGHNAQIKPTQFLDSWKNYNIAVGKSKTQQFDEQLNEYTNVPEILLYSDYNSSPPKENNLIRNYLWKARPWGETQQQQNNKYNTLLAEKSASYQNKHIDGINSLLYQTKLNKMDRSANIVKDIRNTKKWGNRFSQGYYGRVFEGQSGFRNTNDKPKNQLPFYSQEMINFDLQNLHPKGTKGHATFHAEKNKHQILNRGRELKSANNKVPKSDKRSKDNNQNVPPYSGHEARQENQKAPTHASLGSDKKVADVMTDNSENLRLNGGKNKTTTGAVIPLSEDLKAASQGVQAHQGYKCPGLFGYHRDPWNCQAFFICSWGMAHRVVCPQGTLYNSKEGVCDWAINVKCPVFQNNKVSPNLW